MNRQLAPIALFVYNRLEHTKVLIEYLQNNKLANESELYIFSDAPKNEEQSPKVNAVRGFIRSIQGFKRIFIIEAEQNRGLAESVISGVSDVINIYGKVIVLEDDLVIAPNFLNYMNDALDFYENNQKIWSITGYNYPIKVPNSYENKVYISYRASSWSWGTWKDRWQTVDWSVSDFKSYRYNPIRIIHFCKGGTDLDKILRNQMKGLIDSWAIRWCYSQSQQGKYTIYPCRALVTNEGTDGTGTHFLTTSDRFKSILDMNFDYEFSSKILIDKEIMKMYRKVVDLSIGRRLKRIITQKGVIDNK